MSKHPNAIGKPLMKVRLSDKQWDQVHKINTALCDEYKTRREMILKRLDVTIQSFMWSEKAKVPSVVYIIEKICIKKYHNVFL
jgi:hypothetical protein